MDYITALAITFAVTGLAMAVYIQIYTRLARTSAESRDLLMRTESIAEKKAAETSAKLEAIANRVERLETGISLEPLAEERVQSIDNRFRDIEKTLEPLKNRRLEVTSTEYQFLMFEIDRLVRDLKEDVIHRQRTFENDLDQRLGNFRTIFIVSLTVVSLIIAGFGVLIYFIGQSQ